MVDDGVMGKKKASQRSAVEAERGGAAEASGATCAFCCSSRRAQL